MKDPRESEACPPPDPPSGSAGQPLPLPPLPHLARVRQRRSTPAVSNPAGRLREELRRFGLPARLRQGQSVAITAGSRGIRDIVTVIRTVAEECRAAGAHPFVVPAMGSHAGATAEGQLALLGDLAITEATVGAPIRSCMEVALVDSSAAGHPIWFDRLAAAADHVVVVNRVKPHTDFSGPIQSGLLKMLLIGLGKHRGALEYHRAFIRESFQRFVAEVGPRVARRCRVLCGVAIVENHRHETGLIDVVEPDDFLARERQLLELAQEWMPRIPFPELDLLVVDRMGKEISGSGMDTNVVGRKGWVVGEFSEQRPRIARIYVRDLTEASSGNAVGIGLADLAHSRLIGKIDFPSTYTNVLTSATPRGASVPPHLASDREALRAALQSLGTPEPGELRLARIHSTLELEELLVSEALLGQARGNPELEVAGEAEPMRFDAAGDLLGW